MASDTPVGGRQGSYQSWLTTVGWALFPFAVVVLVMIAQFRGLREEAAVEQAVVARRLVQGRGFTTPIIRPRSLAYHPSLTNHPELRQGPLSVLPTALLVRLVGENQGRAGALASMLAWLVAVGLAYRLAASAAGRSAGLLAVVFLSLSPVGLSYAISGDGRAWAMPLLLALWLALTRVAPATRAPLAGFLIALLALTVPGLTLPLLCGVLPTLLFAAPGAPSRRTAPLVALAVVVVVALPWLVRNQRVAGTPLPGLGTYDVMKFTEALPGRSIDRRYVDPGASVPRFVADHQRQLARKILAGAHNLHRAPGSALDWPLLGLALAALVSLSGPLAAGRGALIGGLGGHVALLSITSQEYGSLAIWSPLLAVYAAIFMAVSLRGRFAEARSPGRCRRWAAAGVVALLAVPGLGPQLFTPEPLGDHPSAANHNLLRNAVGTDEVILTDDPWTVALYCDRVAVWLPQDTTDLEAIEKLGAVRAIYFTRAAGGIVAAEAGPWWSWARVMASGFRDYVPGDSRVPGERILINQQATPKR